MAEAAGNARGVPNGSPCVSQVPMTTNGGAHKFNKNDNNWLHTHFEPQQVDVVVSSIEILALDSLSAFARNHPLTFEFTYPVPVRFSSETFIVRYFTEVLESNLALRQAHL